MEYHSGGSLPLLGRPRYCPGASANGGYLCETGHCCGEAGCCTYYYELWWFWLLWTALILFSCCCAYRHRRAKLRVQQQQRESSLLAYQGAPSYPSSMLDLSFLASLKLPSYEEVAAQPSTPPPPYSSVFTSPRYPQPPRCCDPHLLTQHGALLHRPLSDGPSSLSSDNSSSCSCDSCCPSSPCSSSLSAPVTYETDTSHATTPSEATPLTLDVTMETVAAAARCLEVSETQLVSETTAASDLSDEDAQEPGAVDPRDPDHTAPVGAGSGPVSPDPLSSPGSELDPHVASPSEQRDSAAVRSHAVVAATPPPIQGIDTGAPAHCLETAPTLKVASKPDPSAPRISDKPASNHTLDLTRTFDCTSVPSSPTPPPDPHLGPAPSNRIQPSDQTALCPTPGSEPAPPDSTQSLDLPPVSDSPFTCAGPSPAPEPAHTELRPGTDTSGQGQNLDLSPASGLSPSPTSLDAAVPADPGLSLALSRSPVLAFPTPAAPPPSCPAITIESDCRTPPPPSPPGPALLLDPLTALHESNRGRCSSGHASSLSPSPRATQSPPKQTLFSPCVDVYEPGPPSWEDGEERRDEEEDDDDVGADESQYRHRRLTGDSGIEVCRCRVEEEEEEEEEEEDGRRRRGKWEDQKGGVATDLHDSEDCPVRGRTTAGDDLCSPASTTVPTSMKVVVVMETV